MGTASSGIAIARSLPLRGDGVRRGIPVVAALRGLGYALLVPFIFFICFTFLRPSPYDFFFAIPAMALWFCLGIRLHRGAVVFVALLLLYHLGLLLALLPYFEEPRPVEWSYQSAYLMVTAIFFAMFFADDTRRRLELVFKAYVASSLFAACAGIASYFELFGEGLLFRMDGRAAGVFEDPNVLGSFLIPAALYLVHNLVGGRSRGPVLAVAALAVIAAGIFLSFSRGSWAATGIATVPMVWLMHRKSASARLRRRIVALAFVIAAATAIALVAALGDGDIAERFEDRAQVTKEYDQGVTGRFGNQIRGIPMLIERPNGLGPLRWRLTFGLEPHNPISAASPTAGGLADSPSWRSCSPQASSAFACASPPRLSSVRRRLRGRAYSSSCFRRSRSTSIIGVTSSCCSAWSGASRPPASIGSAGCGAARPYPPEIPTITLPLPAQVLHGAAPIRPLPPQSGHRFSPVPGVPGFA